MDFSKDAEQSRYEAGTPPQFNREALFSDMTENYVSPMEPKAYDRVTIRFRTEKNNIDRIYLVSGNEKHLMLKSESDEQFDYYDHEVQLEGESFGYYFEIQAGQIICYYDSRGITQDISDYHMMRIIPGFKTPDWAKGAVIYQIYVDRFCNGNPRNDVLTGEYQYVNDKTVKVDDWSKYPAAMGVREFYGGDLQGVIDKMDYLEELGIDVIYFNPLFVSPSNHKYDIQDYDYIDPHFGNIVSDSGELLNPEGYENRYASRYINRVSNKDNLEASNLFFAKLVKEAHKRGIKVILDGVFNHCGSFNKWMDRERIYENAPGYAKGAFVDRESPYRDYFRFHRQDEWPYNSHYDGWWGFDTLPKLNYEASNELFHYIMNIAAKWVSPPYNADGWRLDVAADLGYSPEYNHFFWKEFRKTVKRANPDAIILAEHYGNASEWLKGDEWDTVMNYDAFMEPLTWFLTGMEKHSDDYRGDLYGNADSFWEAMRNHLACFTMPSLLVAMNELSNHDHSRFLTRTNKKVGRTNNLGAAAADEGVNKAVMREAVVMQMTWPGAPTIYYGDEAGLCGFTDPDNRRTYPWGREDKEMITFHKEMIRIHKENRELISGSLRALEGGYNLLVYGRFTRAEQSVIIVNNNDYEIHKEITIWHLGVPKQGFMKQLMCTDAEGFNTEEKKYPVNNGKINITLPKTAAVVLKYQQNNGKNEKNLNEKNQGEKKAEQRKISLFRY